MECPQCSELFEAPSARPARGAERVVVVRPAPAEYPSFIKEALLLATQNGDESKAAEIRAFIGEPPPQQTVVEQPLGLREASAKLRAEENAADQAAKSVAALESKLVSAKEKLAEHTKQVSHWKKQVAAHVMPASTQPVELSLSAEAEASIGDDLKKTAEELGISEEEHKAAADDFAAAVSARQAAADAQRLAEQAAAKIVAAAGAFGGPQSKRRRKADAPADMEVETPAEGAPAARAHEVPKTTGRAKELLLEAQRAADVAAGVASQPVSVVKSG